MAKDDKRTLTPRLRFPEFRNGAGWVEMQLATVCERIMDGTHFSPKSKVGTKLYLTSKNIRDGRLDLTDLSYISEDEHREIYKRCPVKTGDVLLTKDGANTGNCALNTLAIEFSLLSSVAVLRGDSKQISQGFLFQSILSDRTRKIIEDSMSGQAITRITLDKLGKYVIPVPSAEEQQKIADCLASLDELIEAQGRNVEALKVHKKALMQQLFPRHGETLPSLRFPEFRDNDRSVFMPIGEIASVTTGDKDTQNKVEGGKYPFFVRSQNVERIDSHSHDGEAVLTSGDGVGVGENYHYIKGKFDFHQRVYCIYDFGDHANGQFFFQYFSTHFKKRVKQMSAKNSVDSVRMSMITEMPIWLPAIAEQQRIADCFANLDAQIAAEADKLIGLKTHKKGLMQQLFPSSDLS